MTDLLNSIVAGLIDQPFAFVARRAQAGQFLTVDILSGPVESYERLADIPSITPSSDPSNAVAVGSQLVLVPYRQIGSLGYDHHDDRAPLHVLHVTQSARHSVQEVLKELPHCPVDLEDAHFDIDDEQYAAMADAIIRNEIAAGEGANFVLSRTFSGNIRGCRMAHVLSLYRALLSKETGAYWTFLVHVAGQFWIGASPEQQVTLRNGVATMNPISGTYRYPASGPTIEGLLDFLDNPKEIDELYMVVDEELKILCRLCDQGVRLRGPFLKEMSSLAHTEYLIEGRTALPAALLLQGTLPAPTIAGSPVRNACRVLSKYEGKGREYYAGAIALIDGDLDGREQLDSAILIRTMIIDAQGRARLPVGATIVRHSDPAQEAAETRAKAAAFVRLFHDLRAEKLDKHPHVAAALSRRNDRVAAYWRSDTAAVAWEPRKKASVAIVDADDDFTQMLAHQLAAMGFTPSIKRASHLNAARDLHQADFVLLGPGPGDPGDMSNPNVRGLRCALDYLLSDSRPFLAICFSHQLLCARLGLTLMRHETPRQGQQQTIEFFGTRATVGFYNTFSALCEPDEIVAPWGEAIAVARNDRTSEVFGTRGRRFSSMQFHPESILSLDGHAIVKREVERLLA